MRLFAFRLGLSLVALTHTISSASAAVGFRQLTSVFPCAVQHGTETTVQVRSNFTLDGAYAVYFDEPGISMKLAEEKPIKAPLEGRGRPGTPFKFSVSVPKDQTPRIYEVRVATPQAVSSVTHLMVTEHPVVEETTKQNGDAATAQTVPVPSAVCGVCDVAEDVDCFRFAGKQGQTISMEIFAQRITAAIHDMVGPNQTYHMDSILTLTGPNGQVVGMNDNAFGGDAAFSVELPTDGDYVLSVRDTRYLGNPRHTYCVEITEGRPPVSTFPLVLQAGTATEVEALTFGGVSIGRAKLAAPKLKALDGQDRMTCRERITVASRPTPPVDFEVAAAPQVTHVEANTHEKPREVTLPIGVNARLTQPGDAHCFAFTAKKDAYYRLAARSRRFNMPVDAVLQVFDAKGKQVAEADDDETSLDALLTFRAPADGPYVVLVRDLHGRGGEEFVYHLAIEPASPDFTVTGKYYYAMVAPGTRALWFAEITRLYGFEGPIELHVDGLPPGVTQTPVTVPAGMNYAAIILSADKDAKIGASLVRISGRSEVRDPATGKATPLVREGSITCELQSSGGSQGHWPVRTSLVGVVEPLDLLSVEATPAEVTLPPGGKAEIALEIKRHADYKEPVSLDFTWQYFGRALGSQLPPGVTLGKGSTARLSGNTLKGKLILEAASTALPVERLPIAVMAGVSISFSIETKYASNPIFLTIPAADKKPVPVAKK